MAERAFLDTNVVVYAFTEDRRSSAAQALLARSFTISVQTLNEIVNVALRKLKRSWREIDDACAQIIAAASSIEQLDLACHRRAMTLARQHKLAIFDAQIVASALQANCDTLYSEDLHDGLVIDGRLTIRNPFAAAAR